MVGASTLNFGSAEEFVQNKMFYLYTYNYVEQLWRKGTSGSLDVFGACL